MRLKNQARAWYELIRDIAGIGFIAAAVGCFRGTLDERCREAHLSIVALKDVERRRMTLKAGG